MFAFGILSIMAVDTTPPPQMMPTMMAMLTQMPPNAVMTQLAQMGYTISASSQATAMAMWQQGVSPDIIMATLMSNNTSSQPTPIPTLQPTVVQPTIMVLPTLVPTNVNVVPLPTAVGATAQPTIDPLLQPTVEGAPTQEILPTTEGGEIVPTVEGDVPTAEGGVPTVEGAAPVVAVGNIAGRILFAGLDTATGINLRLTRPDGTTLELPVGADGAFAFSSMLPGTYLLDAYATGYLSARAEFTLDADQTLQLPDEALVAGDTNADNVIDLLDAALIASNFDGPAVVPEADLNRDGWVDVVDLTLLGNQFGQTGPLNWK